MSAWMEVTCLRVPLEALGFAGDLWEFCDEHEEEPAFDRGEAPDWKYPFLEPAPTLREFLDLVLSENVTEKRGGFGRTRALTEREKKKYIPVFLKYFPDMDTGKLRYVHYAWYDGCEAPDYYEEE